VRGSTIYVDDDSGGDFSNIQEAIDAADDGDTIYVYNGIYYENIVINKTITLIGEDREQTIIDGGKIKSVVRVTANFVNISGFSMVNGGDQFTESGIKIHSSYNKIIGNNISSNHKMGLYMENAYFNEISDNYFLSNNIGIYLSWSRENEIEGNLIIDNQYGLFFEAGRENDVFENTIEGNTQGFYKDVNSYGNMIYHNNFLENSIQAIDDHQGDWDNGAEGNFWSNYNGLDDNEDGIGESPYDIDGDSKDNFPLMYIYPDISSPLIDLNNPENNSVNKAGVIIDLSVTDENLKEVEYSINDGTFSTLDPPYDITTNSWTDGDYSIKVRASDKSGKKSSKDYNIVIDSTKPIITLNSPSNNDLIRAGTDIDLMIIEDNINTSHYTINSGISRDLDHPYNINTHSWSDGAYTIRIYVNDLAGNEVTKTYAFHIDSTYPMITLTAPTNNSLIITGSMIEYDISDENLNEVSLSIDGGAFHTLAFPYNIDTFGWSDGEHTIEIEASDLAGNRNGIYCGFTLDGKPPEISDFSPKTNSIDIPLNTSIIITFSESMDTSSVESALKINPSTRYSLEWENNYSILTIIFTEPLDYDTFYEISIGTQAKDLIGHNLENKIKISFTTQEEQKEANNESSIMVIFLIILLTLIAVIFAVILIMTKRKKMVSHHNKKISQTTSISSMRTSSTIQSPLAQEPNMLKIKCTNCQNVMHVKDLGAVMKVNCPFCSTTLSVQSRVQSLQQQKPQMTNTQITCPRCKTNFSIMRNSGSMIIQCPKCGLRGRG
jgi:parallel beta-helix repeat protein